MVICASSSRFCVSHGPDPASLAVPLPSAQPLRRVPLQRVPLQRVPLRLSLPLLSIAVSSCLNGLI